MHRVKFNDYAELLSDDLNNNNAYLYNGLITTISDFIAANDCVSGLEVTAQAVPDMTVYVKSGRIYQNGYQGLLEADLTTPLTIAPASSNQPRIDLICAKYEEVEDEPEIRNVLTDVVSRNVSQVEVKTRIASSIAFQVVGGTAAAEPTVPTTPEGWVALAKVTVPANASVIQQSNIVDMRPEIINIYQHDHSGGANGAKLDYNNLNNLPDLSDFTGATSGVAGKRGMVPAPAAGDQNKALFGDATYKQVVQKVNGVAPDSGGNVNVDMSDYLPLTGGTLTGSLNIQRTADYSQICIITNSNRQRRLDAGDTYLRLAVMADEDTDIGGRYVILNAGNAKEDGLSYQINDNGSWSTYKIFGEHNIATEAQAELGTNNTNPMTPLRVKQAINALALPKGTILPFAGGTIPSGFLACNGAAVSRTTYAALFSAIGTTYGSGDGSTTFNLPAVEDNRFLEFSSTRGTKKNAGLPDITGSMTCRQTDESTGASGRGVFGGATGAFVITEDVPAVNFSYINLTAQSQLADSLTFDASRSSSIYGGSTTVQPKSLTVRAIIKY